LACAPCYRTRWVPLTVAGAATLTFLAFLVFVLPNDRLHLLDGFRSQLAQGTAKVRVLIWEGATDLLAARPLRAITGYGPDTMALAYEPFYPPELARYEGRIVTPDRAHNETFDALLMTGIIGGATQ